MSNRTNRNAIEIIQVELNSSDHAIRKAGIKRLMRYQRALALEPLLVLLGDTRSDVRAKAAEALGQLKDKRALEPLLALLADKNVSVQKQAAKALGGFEDRRAVPALLKLLNGPKQVRLAAARSLGQLQDPAALPALLVYLQQAERESLYDLVFAISAFDLPAVVEPLLALCTRHDDLQVLVASALNRLSTSSTPVLLGILSDQRRPVAVRRCVALACSQQPRTGSVQALIKALDDSDLKIRRLAARALGLLQDPGAIEPLIRHLADEDALLSQVVIGALRYLEASEATDALIGSLSSPHENVVAEAASALEHFKATSAVPALLDALCQGRNTHNWPVAAALCRLGDPELVGELLQRLPVIPPQLHSPVLHILESFPDPRAVETLLTLLNFEMQDGYDLHFQKRIVRLLGKIGAERALEPLREKIFFLEKKTRDRLLDAIYAEICRVVNELEKTEQPD